MQFQSHVCGMKYDVPVVVHAGPRKEIRRADLFSGQCQTVQKNRAISGCQIDVFRELNSAADTCLHKKGKVAVLAVGRKCHHR